jgi:hypothetical protein
MNAELELIWCSAGLYSPRDLLRSQCHQRIDAGRASRGDVARQSRDDEHPGCRRCQSALRRRSNRLSKNTVDAAGVLDGPCSLTNAVTLCSGIESRVRRPEGRNVRTMRVGRDQLRFVERRAEHDHIDDTEHRGVRAGAERDHQERDSGEAGRPDHQANGRAGITRDRVELTGESSSGHRHPLHLTESCQRVELRGAARRHVTRGSSHCGKNDPGQAERQRVA